MVQFKIHGIVYSPKVTCQSVLAVVEVELSQFDPLSEDLTMFPEEPTVTNTPEPEEVLVVSSSVVVEEPLSLLLLQEMTVRLKRDMRIMYKTLFIFFLHQ